MKRGILIAGLLSLAACTEASPNAAATAIDQQVAGPAACEGSLVAPRALLLPPR